MWTVVPFDFSATSNKAEVEEFLKELIGATTLHHDPKFHMDCVRARGFLFAAYCPRKKWDKMLKAGHYTLDTLDPFMNSSWREQVEALLEA